MGEEGYLLEELQRLRLQRIEVADFLVEVSNTYCLMAASVFYYQK